MKLRGYKQVKYKGLLLNIPENHMYVFTFHDGDIFSSAFKPQLRTDGYSDYWEEVPRELVAFGTFEDGENWMSSIVSYDTDYPTDTIHCCNGGQ